MGLEWHGLGLRVGCWVSEWGVWSRGWAVWDRGVCVSDAAPLPASVSRLGSVCWRVDYTLSSSELQEVHEPLVHLTFTVWDRQHGSTEAVPMAVSADKFRVLLAGEAAEGEVAAGVRGRCGARAAPPWPTPCLRRAEAGAGADEHTELSRAAVAGGPGAVEASSNKGVGDRRARCACASGGLQLPTGTAARCMGVKA